MSKTTLNTEGEASAIALIRAGHYDMASPWEFSAEDGNALLGPDGDDWEKYGRWHLGEDPSENAKTKAHWKYPHGKDGKVYRRAVASIRSRSAQNDDGTISDAAGRLMTAMDEEEKKKESNMSLRQILTSRFGHFAGFAAAAAKPADDDNSDDDDEDAGAKKAAAKKAADEEEAKRKAEEEEAEKARKARRARKARKARKAKGAKQDDDNDDDDDDDDAGDDNEDDDDDNEMKKAAAAGHSFALDAAFRTGARAQRRRCAAILAAASAAANPVLAMSLAFETSMTADAAIGVLEKTPAPPRAGSLHQRMDASGAAGIRIPASAPGAPSGKQAIATSWDNALKEYSPAR
jgi:hypothetical protein